MLLACYLKAPKVWQQYLSLLGKLLEKGKAGKVMSLLAQQNNINQNFGMQLISYNPIKTFKVLRQFLSLLGALLKKGKADKVMNLLAQQDDYKWNFGTYLVSCPSIIGLLGLQQYLSLLKLLIQKNGKSEEAIRNIERVLIVDDTFVLAATLAKQKILYKTKILWDCWDVATVAVGVIKSKKLAIQILWALMKYQEKLADNYLAPFGVIINQILTHGDEEARNIIYNYGITCSFNGRLFFEAANFFINRAAQKDPDQDDLYNSDRKFAALLCETVYYNSSFTKEAKQKIENLRGKFVTGFVHPEFGCSQKVKNKIKKLNGGGTKDRLSPHPKNKRFFNTI